MITKFLLSIEPIRETIDGTAKMPGKGPEIFLDAPWRETVLRPVMQSILAHTQLPEDAINWLEVVSNWGMPFPAGLHPEPDLFS